MAGHAGRRTGRAAHAARVSVSEDYYERKARKNAETVDFVIKHWCSIVLVLILIGLVLPWK